MSTKEEEIFDACESGTYKYALQLSQKLLKKYPNSTYYQLIHQYVQLQMGKKEECQASCLKIMESVPNDPKSIELLCELFESMNMEEQSKQVYANVAKKYPTLDTLLQWFHKSVENGDYRSMQKAAMSLKQVSSQRLIQCWAGFTCFLALQDDECTSLEKTLFPKLGLKIMDALKPMEDEQETYVLVKLLQKNGLHERVVEEILTFSKEDKLDLELQIILLQTLDSLEKWDDLFNWSHKILVDYKLDDFDCWKYLIKSGLKLDRDVTSVIKSFDSRNSQLASVELDKQYGNDCNESMFTYLSNFITKPCCFYDLKHYVDFLDKNKLLNWLSDLAIPKGEKGLIVDLNIRKIKLWYDRNLLESEEFMDDLIKMYNFYKPLLQTKAKTDLSATSEFILMIIQCLLTQKFSTETLITSIVILETAILKDEHEFHLRLWLIQIYTLLNCHSEAQHHYDTLHIKNIQHDILDHYLLSRSASISSSITALESSYSIYKSNDFETVYFNKLGFNKGAYNKLAGMLEFQKRLKKSYFKRHLAIQGVKMGRLLNDKGLTQDYKKVKISKEYDNRDLKIFWNFGIDEPLEISVKLLETVTDEHYNFIMDTQERLISGELDAVPNLDFSGLSKAESWGFNTIIAVYEFLTDKCSMDKVRKQFRQVPDVPIDSNWKLSHNFITIIDSLKCIQSLLITFGKQKKGLNELRELNASLMSSFRDDVLTKRQDLKAVMQKHKTNVRRSAVLEKLQFEGSVEKVFDIIDRGHLEQFKILRLM
jgi:N-terminal acetyltransferase B complex non-catalytic subunit